MITFSLKGDVLYKFIDGRYVVPRAMQLDIIKNVHVNGNDYKARILYFQVKKTYRTHNFELHSLYFGHETRRIFELNRKA